MKIRVYRNDKSVPLPERKTEKSVGLDVCSAERVELYPGEVKMVKTGLIIEAPAGFYFRIHIRSGFSVKNGISLANDVGIIDEDYCGAEDEVRIALIRHYNPREEHPETPFVIEKGMRIAQIIFERNTLSEIEWDEQTDPGFAGKTRGGFGSTGMR